MHAALFTGITVGTIPLRNRIVRSATYEGAADASGRPGELYAHMYAQLAPQNIGLVITGFCFVSRAGHAMQPRQAGLDNPDFIPDYRRVTDEMHRHATPIVAQLAHAGRQTLRAVTGTQPIAPTSQRSSYFRSKPRLLDRRDAMEIISQFARAARHAYEAGFDGVQLHMAHGYLLHQLLRADVNRLDGEYGIDPARGIGTALAERIVDAIRSACGPDYPILVKISGETDAPTPFYPDAFDRTIAWIDALRLAAIEISYGTMDYAINIFRGDAPIELALRHNPLFRTRSPLRRAVYRWYFRTRLLPVFIPYSPMYNLAYAARAKTLTDIPVISVGGMRSKHEMGAAIADGKTDLVAMSRPFLREPDFVLRMMQSDGDCVSLCEHCNRCALMCDAGRTTTCHQRHHTSQEGTSS